MLANINKKLISSKLFQINLIFVRFKKIIKEIGALIDIVTFAPQIGLIMMKTRIWRTRIMVKTAMLFVCIMVSNVVYAQEQNDT